jgi:hypothetical protein
MLMPEAAVDKYGDPIARQNEVRLAWEIFTMQPKAKTSSMQTLAYR